MPDRDPKPLNLPALLASAQAANAEAPGPWSVEWTGRADRTVEYIRDVNGLAVVCADSGAYEPRGAVAEHIAAADPATIEALVLRIQELESLVASTAG